MGAILGFLILIFLLFFGFVYYRISKNSAEEFMQMLIEDEDKEKAG
jgi:hypothetical protein